MNSSEEKTPPQLGSEKGNSGLPLGMQDRDILLCLVTCRWDGTSPGCPCGSILHQRGLELFQCARDCWERGMELGASWPCQGGQDQLQTSCLGTETPLAPDDSAWNQTGQAESFPCIQVCPLCWGSLKGEGVKGSRAPQSTLCLGWSCWQQAGHANICLHPIPRASDLPAAPEVWV